MATQPAVESKNARPGDPQPSSNSTPAYETKSKGSEEDDDAGLMTSAASVVKEYFDRFVAARRRDKVYDASFVKVSETKGETCHVDGQDYDVGAGSVIEYNHDGVSICQRYQVRWCRGDIGMFLNLLIRVDGVTVFEARP